MDNLAPIVLFVYNRPEHTLKVLNALQKNELASKSELYIFSDGPKEHCSEIDRRNIEKVRLLIREQLWCKYVTVFESDINKGLANSIIDGVSKIITKHKKVIVLEDDILPEIGFLRYMNDALNMYEYEKNVGCIHAWNYSLDTKKQKDSTFFLKGADCWGWATWKDSWDLFEFDGQKLLDQIINTNTQYDFDRRGTHPFMQMLKDQINGVNDSWAIRWHASLFLEGKFCLHPIISIVNNIGFDNSGTHCSNIFIEQKQIKYIKLNQIKVEESEWFFNSYMKQNVKTFNIKASLKYYLKLILPPVFLKLFKRKLVVKKMDNNSVWEDSFSNWEEASQNAIVYHHSLILEKVTESMLKVKNNEALYERDSTIFNDIQHNWVFLSAIQKIIIDTSCNLNVLDFGGSLGNNFFYIKNVIGDNRIDKWSIIEQEHFVERGLKLFQNEKLKFYYTIDECIKNNNPNLIILGSVLQYLENPYEIFEKLLQTNVKFILIDRTVFIDSSSDCISLQNIPLLGPKVQHWFFSLDKFLNLLKKYNRVIIISENSYIQFNNNKLGSVSNFFLIK